MTLLLGDYKIEAIIHGGARGADTMAGEFANANGIREVVFEADWRKYGRSAGPRRNQQMIDEVKPNLVVAFPGGRGTADMVERARLAGVTVIEIAPPARDVSWQSA